MDSEDEKKLAQEFDQLKKASQYVETPTAPPGEFEKILEEMNRRGIKPRIRNELEK